MTIIISYDSMVSFCGVRNAVARIVWRWFMHRRARSAGGMAATAAPAGDDDGMAGGMRIFARNDKILAVLCGINSIIAYTRSITACAADTLDVWRRTTATAARAFITF